MSQWTKITNEDELTEEVQVYEYQGKPIAIFKLNDGYYAIEDVCSHEESSLSDGEIEDGKVECPVHGALFDIRTGKNLTLPAVLPVKSYPIKVEGGAIYLQFDD